MEWEAFGQSFSNEALTNRSREHEPISYSAQEWSSESCHKHGGCHARLPRATAAPRGQGR